MQFMREQELQARELLFSVRQHSYELTQKLTYFVISIELVFCGYMLLNADKLSGMQGASYLFATCGAAGFFGIIWRFFYNQTYHNSAHGLQGKLNDLSGYSQTICYWIYVALSITAFLWAMIAGFSYLEAASNSPHATDTARPSHSNTSALNITKPSGLKTPQPIQIKSLEPSSRTSALKPPSASDRPNTKRPP